MATTYEEVGMTKEEKQLLKQAARIIERELGDCVLKPPLMKRRRGANMGISIPGFGRFYASEISVIPGVHPMATNEVYFAAKITTKMTIRFRPFWHLKDVLNRKLLARKTAQVSPPRIPT
jgi:hypothetical protein